MKTIVFTVCLLFATANGDVKWIPITPLDTGENPKPDTNRSKLQHSNTLIENVNVIRRLLDATGKDDQNEEENKHWYSLKPIENR